MAFMVIINIFFKNWFKNAPTNKQLYVIKEKYFSEKVLKNNTKTLKTNK